MTIQAKPTKHFGQTFEGNFPEGLRRQLWPLCCGASILSGFKNVVNLTDDELVNQINEAIDDHIPDFQVYKGETMTPKLTFLTLNEGQAQSKKITGAVEKAGFVLFATARPRGGLQHFYVKDTSNTFQSNEVKVGG